VRAADLREHPIRVAIRVADRALRERTARTLQMAGEFTSGDAAEADVTIADRSGDFAGPVIALAPRAAAATWRCDVRAVLPPDVDAALLGAVIMVIAAGMSVAPRTAPASWRADGPASGRKRSNVPVPRRKRAR
jgi:hypothetical protein